ncbi:hypothetical protein GCM10018780_12580 [Streptomyces lanatus]|nr:hypothetical protein GCM10018780_12580 [Streptomyces lanatus]
MHFAFRSAEARGCALDAVRAWSWSAQEGAGTHEKRAAARLDDLLGEAEAEHPTVPVRRTTIEGPPGHILVARSSTADLVVIGARHRHGHFGLQLGRTSHTLLHHARCPVAVVPQLA